MANLDDELFGQLRPDLASYLDEKTVLLVQEAYLLAKKAHEGQIRASGEPYITHPVAVTKILAGLKMDHETLMAALMHDVIEDTPISKNTLIEKFGPQVADLVDGVSKLTQIEFQSRAEAQAENFRKMVLAMVQDIRVILVKLADRLHNVQTLDVLPQEKRRRIARETLEIYAPIASRLGMYNFRKQFEDYSFQALYPMRYRVLQNIVEQTQEHRQEIHNIVETTLKQGLAQNDLPPSLLWNREMHLYMIYRLMRDQHIPFAELMDMYTYRIIVDRVDSCYRVLGAIHQLYKPVPERFKDYIAIPKANGYQSLHTTLFGPYGVPLEVQIRTHEMNLLAESGIAAHWQYKLSNATNEAHQRAQDWLKGLLEMQQSADDSLEFIENVKIDLFPDEVYVFTPKGNIIELPHGATPIDFAYAVHTEIGNACVATKIDRRLAPLSTPLFSGQTVEIITAAKSLPNPAWLNFVITGKARSNIRHALKKQQRAESIAFGERLLTKSLDTLKLSLDTVSADHINKVLHDLNIKSLDDLYESIGLGNQMPQLIAMRLTGNFDPKKQSPIPTPTSIKPLLIKGSGGMVLQFAECCLPIPGDPIIGILSAGTGITVHQEHCPKAQIFRGKPHYINIQWENPIEGLFNVEILVELRNQRGVLAELAKVISDTDTNINDIHINKREGDYATVTIMTQVDSRIHLAKVLRRIRTLKSVNRLIRNRPSMPDEQPKKRH